MTITIRAMDADDYPAVAELWRRTEGIGLNESDTNDAVAVYLRRNPGMSAVGQSQEGVILGAVLCGHDGRRGYLHHLAVDPAHRHQGIARRLLEWCFDRLHEAAVPKCNIGRIWWSFRRPRRQNGDDCPNGEHDTNGVMGDSAVLATAEPL
jgi:putative acetyltransferase